MKNYSLCVHGSEGTRHPGQRLKVDAGFKASAEPLSLMLLCLTDMKIIHRTKPMVECNRKSCWSFYFPIFFVFVFFTPNQLLYFTHNLIIGNQESLKADIWNHYT